MGIEGHGLGEVAASSGNGITINAGATLDGAGSVQALMKSAEPGVEIGRIGSPMDAPHLELQDRRSEGAEPDEACGRTAWNSD